MANFKTAFDITNKNEGGYANNLADHGGETYAGISRKNWPEWHGWKLIDQCKATRWAYGIDKTMAENPFMQSYVTEFYRTNFWNPLKLDLVNDQQIANAVYDFGINAGIVTSAKMLQNSVAGSIIADGVIGPITIQKVNSDDPKDVLSDFNEQRSDFYHHLASNPGQSQFLASWLSRIRPYQV